MSIWDRGEHVMRTTPRTWWCEDFMVQLGSTTHEQYRKTDEGGGVMTSVFFDGEFVRSGAIPVCAWIHAESAVRRTRWRLYRQG